jgi:protein SERAC1
MWLRDSLAYDLIFDNDEPPVARIMIYGYESSLPASDSFQNLEDLTTSFHTALLALV